MKFLCPFAGGEKNSGLNSLPLSKISVELSKHMYALPFPGIKGVYSDFPGYPKKSMLRAWIITNVV